MRVLLVDDSEIDTLLTRAALERAAPGAEVQAVDQATVALQLLRTPDAPAFDLILLDLNMPVMDGFELIEAFEQLAPRQRRAAIVVLSNSPLASDRARSLAYSSVRDYITKPLSLESAAGLQRWAGGGSSSR